MRTRLNIKYAAVFVSLQLYGDSIDETAEKQYMFQ